MEARLAVKQAGVRRFALALKGGHHRAQAIDQFRVAVRLDADTYRMDLARALAGTGRPADAVLEYEQVLAGSPNNVPAMEDLARLYDGRGETQRALSLWRQVAASNPK